MAAAQKAAACFIVENLLYHFRRICQLIFKNILKYFTLQI